MKKLSQINEGMVSAIKASFQITKAQGKVIKYFEDNRDKYKTPEDVQKDLDKVAKQAYDECVKEEDAVKFNEWFPNFKKSFLNELKNKAENSNS